MQHKHFWKRKRVKWFKKIFRYAPRKATIHRYPGLRFFANSARKRSYLWSFRVGEVVPALYAGWILTLMPVMGIQILLALALALLLRANLMVLVGLQMLSNPLTIGIIWPFNYKVGRMLMSIFEKSNNASQVDETLVQATGSSELTSKGIAALHGFAAICIGALVMGYILGFISSWIYRKMMQNSSSISRKR